MPVEDERDARALARLLLTGMVELSEESQRVRRLPRCFYVFIYLGTLVFLFMFAVHVSGIVVGIVDGSNACQADRPNRLQPWVLMMSTVALVVWTGSIFLTMTGQLFPQYDDRCNGAMVLLNLVGFVFLLAWSIWGCVLLVNKNTDCLDEPLGRVALVLLIFWGTMVGGCLVMLPCLLSERCFLCLVKCIHHGGEEEAPLVEEDVA